MAGRRQGENNLQQPVAEQGRYEFLRELQSRDANLIHASQDVVLTNMTYESMNVVGQDIVERNITIESLAAVMKRKLKEAQQNTRPATGNTSERGTADP